MEYTWGWCDPLNFVYWLYIYGLFGEPQESGKGLHSHVHPRLQLDNIQEPKEFNSKIPTLWTKNPVHLYRKERHHKSKLGPS